MKIHEIINGLFELQYAHGIEFKEIRFENFHDVNYIAITIKTDGKIMKQIFSAEHVSENPIRLGEDDNDYLDFGFDRMVEEIKGEKNETYQRNE